MAKYNKDFKALVAKALEAGWRTEWTNGHMALYSPNEEHSPVVAPASASDHRAYRNFRSELRKRGLQV